MDLILFDLDMTLVDTSALEALRSSKKWKSIKKSLNLTNVYPGILMLLEHLRKEYSVVVVTSSPRGYAEAILNYHELKITNIIAYHDTKNHKPDPEPLIKAIKKYSDDYAKVLHIGDEIVDIQAAYKAKVYKSYLALWGGIDPKNLSDIKIPYQTVETPQQLLELIRGERKVAMIKLKTFNVNPVLEMGLALGNYYKKYSQYNDQISISIREGFKNNNKHHVKFWSDLAAFSIKNHLEEEEVTIDHVIRILGSSELEPSGTSPLDILCNSIAESLSCKYSPELLRKTHATRPLKQTNLRSEREEELKGVYQVSDGVIKDGESLLLVDDISTSGTSSQTVANQILENFPYVKIYFFVLTKTCNPAFGDSVENDSELRDLAQKAGIIHGEDTLVEAEEIKAYKYAIGIDLGTTNSLLAYTILANNDSETHFLSINQPTTTKRRKKDVLCPSVVYYHKKSDKLYIGKGAEDKKYSAVQGVNVFSSSKSELGQKVIFSKSQRRDIVYPYQVSSHVIEYLLKEFKKNVHGELDDCKIVVTVPASFGGSQRTDTLKAIAEAGVNVSEGDLIDEPNAAFVGYLTKFGNQKIPDGSRILIFDMGGGTTDISIVKLLHGGTDEYDVKNLAISRYDLIGGDDIDTHIATAHLLPKLLEENNVSLDEWTYSVREKLIMSKLRKVAKALKESLSSKVIGYIRQENGSSLNSIPWEKLPVDSEVSVEMPDESFKVRKKTYTLSKISMHLGELRAYLEPFTDPKGFLDARKGEYNIISIKSLLSSLEMVSMIAPEKINYILFVGGSTLNPFIIEGVHDYYPTSEVLEYDEPDDVNRVVAWGAARFARQIALKKQIPIIPIVPDKIGILISGREFVPILPGGVEVPYPIDSGDFCLSDPLNLPSSTSQGVQIPICIGSAQRIYQTIRIPKDKISGEVVIGFRVTEGKTLECEIRHEGNPINFELNNPISVYGSDDKRIQELDQALYEHRNAVLKKLPGVDQKALKVVEEFIKSKKHPQGIEIAKSLLQMDVDKEIKIQALFKLGYMTHGEEAIEYYTKYMKHIPEGSAVSFNLGLEYIAINKKDEADKVWDDSIKGGYSSQFAHIALANLRKDKNEDYRNLAKKGIKDVQLRLKKGDAEDICFYWIIKGYELLGDETMVKSWKLKRDVALDSMNKVYDESTLLEGGLMGVDEL